MISQCFHTNQYPFHITSTCYTEGLHVSYMEVVPHTATSMHFPMLPHSFRMFHATSTCRVEYSAMGYTHNFPWVKYIKGILDECGLTCLSYLWTTQQIHSVAWVKNYSQKNTFRPKYPSLEKHCF